MPQKGKGMSQPGSADANRDTDRMWAYHEQTKHSIAALQRSPHFLDWDNQPSPFRTYHGAPRVSLQREPDFPSVGTFAAMRHAAEPGRAPTRREPITGSTVGQLLYYSMAISAWKKVRRTNTRYSLRVNPSSGNLHPTETYVMARALGDIDAGVYHYDVAGHALELRRAGLVFGRLAAACRHERIAAADLVVILTTVFWREAWKYRDRAYRYCLHDGGHAAASMLIAAAGLGLSGYLVGHFADAELAGLIGTDQSDEHPLVVIPLSGRGHGEGASGDDEPIAPLQGRPNRLSPKQVPYPLIEQMHAATCLPTHAGPCPCLQAAGPPAPAAEQTTPAAPSADPPLGTIVRRRRSAIDYDDAFWIDVARLHALLQAAGADFPADFRGNATTGCGRDLIRLFAYVHRVKGVAPGVYAYERVSRRLSCRRSGDVRPLAARLSLGQSIAADCVAAFSMIADLTAASRLFGNRGYRYAHFEAGFIGQRTYLAAEALGFNATGIGAFFDDDVHACLGLNRDEGQVVYHFCIGRALADDRLVTVAAPAGAGDD